MSFTRSDKKYTALKAKGDGALQLIIMIKRIISESWWWVKRNRNVFHADEYKGHVDMQ